MTTSLKRIISLALASVVFLAGLAFYLRNDQSAALDYFLGDLVLPFSVWLLITLVAGVLLGWLTLIPIIFNLKRQKAGLQRRLKISEAEINNLRVLPVKDIE
jgi:putative membrane protein